MEKVMVGKRIVGVTPAVIAGAMVNGKPNFLTLGNYGNISHIPVPIVFISVNKAHYTNAGIKENGYFSINLPSKDLVQKTDYVGLVSGKDVDKSRVFNVFYGSVEKAPMIKECPVNIICRLLRIFDLPNQEIFIGEVMETFVNKECCEEDKPILMKVNPLLLGSRTYWELGNKVGDAFEDGKSLIKERENAFYQSSL
jgi:flavin reductase (DIM6/NTAB) family NADH-FMN oxidoreductase RutF